MFENEDYKRQVAFLSDQLWGGKDATLTLKVGFIFSLVYQNGIIDNTRRFNSFLGGYVW